MPGTTTTVANRSTTNGSIILFQNIKECNQNTSSRGSNRMTQRDSTTVYVDTTQIETTQFCVRKCDYGKGFVDFMKVHVRGFDTSILQRDENGKRGSRGKIDRSTSCITETSDSSQQFETQFLCTLCTHDKQCRRSIIQSGSVRSSHGSVLCECRTKTRDLVKIDPLELLILVNHRITLSRLY